MTPTHDDLLLLANNIPEVQNIARRKAEPQLELLILFFILCWALEINKLNQNYCHFFCINRREGYGRGFKIWNTEILVKKNWHVIIFFDKRLMRYFLTTGRGKNAIRASGNRLIEFLQWPFNSVINLQKVIEFWLSLLRWKNSRNFPVNARVYLSSKKVTYSSTDLLFQSRLSKVRLYLLSKHEMQISFK